MEDKYVSIEIQMNEWSNSLWVQVELAIISFVGDAQHMNIEGYPISRNTLGRKRGKGK